LFVIWVISLAKITTNLKTNAIVLLLEKTRKHDTTTKDTAKLSHKPIFNCNIQHITCQEGKGVGVGEEQTYNTTVSVTWTLEGDRW